jgi:hypothetical protein
MDLLSPTVYGPLLLLLYNTARPLYPYLIFSLIPGSLLYCPDNYRPLITEQCEPIINWLRLFYLFIDVNHLAMFQLQYYFFSTQLQNIFIVKQRQCVLCPRGKARGQQYTP